MAKTHQIAFFIISIFIIIALILIFTLRKSSSDQPEVFVTGFYEGETFFRDAGTIIAGATLPAGAGYSSFLAKYSNSGSMEWAARQDGGGTDNGRGVATDSQNNVFMTGYNGSTGISFYSEGSDDAIFTLPVGAGTGSFLAKYSNSGLVEWAARQDGSGTDHSYGVATDSQNNVFMTGRSASGISFYSKQTSDGPSFTLPAGTGTGSFLAKYTNSGSVSWAARQDGGGTDIGYGVATDSQNNVYMTGSNGSTGISFYSTGNNDGASFTLPGGTGIGSFLAKYTNSGSVSWAARQDGGGTDIGYGVATDSQNNVYMTGIFGGFGLFGISFYSSEGSDGLSVTIPAGTGIGSFLAKYNNSGSVDWAARQKGGGTDAYGYDVATDSQNNVYMTGSNSSAGISFYSSEGSDGPSVTIPPGTTTGSFLAKYTNSGNVDWAARQDGGDIEFSYGVATDSQNNVYMTGDFYGSVSGISFYNQGYPNTIVFTLDKIGASDNSTFTSKYNSKGEFQWAAVIGPSVSGKTNTGYSIATT